MTETASSAPNDDPADERVHPDDMDKLMTEGQREYFLTLFDEKNTGETYSETLQHQHRARDETTIDYSVTHYEPAGYSVEFTRDRNLRTLKFVSEDIIPEEGESPRKLKITEIYVDILSGGTPEDDSFDLIERYVDPITRKPIDAPPDIGIVRHEEIEPGHFVEDVVLQEKKDAHIINQGRWQHSVDVMRKCVTPVG